MLKMAGVQTHPVVRILIGGVLIALGIPRDNVTPALIIGGVLVVWGFVAALGLVGGASEARSSERRSR